METTRAGHRVLLRDPARPGAGLMIGAGVAEIFLGVKAERKSLESIAQPLTAT